MSATVEFSRDVMLGMLRKGKNGNEIMDILNVIAPESDGDSAASDYGQGNGFDPTVSQCVGEARAWRHSPPRRLPGQLPFCA